MASPRLSYVVILFPQCQRSCIDAPTPLCCFYGSCWLVSSLWVTEIGCEFIANKPKVGYSVSNKVPPLPLLSFWFIFYIQLDVDGEGFIIGYEAFYVAGLKDVTAAVEDIGSQILSFSLEFCVIMRESDIGCHDVVSQFDASLETPIRLWLWLRSIG